MVGWGTVSVSPGTHVLSAIRGKGDGCTLTVRYRHDVLFAAAPQACNEAQRPAIYCIFPRVFIISILCYASKTFVPFYIGITPAACRFVCNRWQSLRRSVASVTAYPRRLHYLFICECKGTFNPLHPVYSACKSLCRDGMITFLIYQSI